MNSKMNTLTGIWVVLMILGTLTAFWGGLFLWLGWRVVLGATATILTALVVGRRLLKARERRWVPEDAHSMARALVTTWGFTLEEGWEIVELLESILRAEHTLAHAWMFVRILMLRTDKERTLGVLRTLANR